MAWAKQKFLKPQKAERAVSASVKRVHAAIQSVQMPPQWDESWKRSKARYLAKNPPDDWNAPLLAGARKPPADCAGENLRRPADSP